MRIVRRLLISALILGVLFVGLNIWGERIAEERVAQAIQDRFDLDERPRVNLRAFPILTTILRGTLPGIEVSASGLTVEDLRVANLTVSLSGIRVDGGLLGGGPLAVVVERGTVEVQVAQAAINRLLEREGEDVRVTLAPGTVRVRGEGTFLGSRHQVDATGRLRLRDRILRFVPEQVLIDGREPRGPERTFAEDRARFQVQIPELPGGFTASEAEPGERALFLRVTLEDERIDLTGPR